MDKATIIGTGLAYFVMYLSVWWAGASLMTFVDYPSVAIVCGGAVAAALMANQMGMVLSLHKVMSKAFKPKVEELAPIIRQLVEFAEVARRDGILALESRTSQIKDPFILMGIQMAIDGTDTELMEKILRSEMESMAARHKTGKAMIDTIGKYAPAFGMKGTLIGLIIMLGDMSDPSKIGTGMAVAMLTTLYGAIIANVMCLPIADKLALYSRRELQIREVIVRGLLSIQEGDNPRVLEQKLGTFLPAKERAALSKKAA